MITVAKKISKAEQARRNAVIKRAKAKRNKLIDAGHAFNPKGLSDSGRQHAAGNQRTRGLKGTAAAAKIREGRAGKATAKKGASNTHTVRKRKK